MEDAIANDEATKDILQPIFFWTWTLSRGKDSLNTASSSSTRAVLIKRAKMRRISIINQWYNNPLMNLRLWDEWKNRTLLGQNAAKRTWTPITTGGSNGNSRSNVADDPPMVNVLKFFTENFEILKIIFATFHKFFAEFLSIAASLLRALPAFTV